MTEFDRSKFLNEVIPSVVNYMMAYHLVLFRKCGKNYMNDLSFSPDYLAERDLFKGKYHPYDDGPITKPLEQTTLILGRSMLKFFGIHVKEGSLSAPIKKGDDIDLADLLPKHFTNRSSKNRLQEIRDLRVVVENTQMIESFQFYADKSTAHVTTKTEVFDENQLPTILLVTQLLYILFRDHLAKIYRPDDWQSYMLDENSSQIWYYREVDQYNPIDL